MPEIEFFANCEWGSPAVTVAAVVVDVVVVAYWWCCPVFQHSYLIYQYS